MRYQINILIQNILSETLNWIQKGQDGLVYFIDPNDKKEISAHYGSTHMAASLILWGKHTSDCNLYDKGIALLESILSRWEFNKTLPEFHFDFNNFALTLVEPLVERNIKEKIRKTVCCTSDSKHNTINWLPMRWIVNSKRLEWTGDNIYKTKIDSYRKLIHEATNLDGGIEDRLPHGLSFNLQYDLATVAVLQYLNVHGEHFNLGKELAFLLNAISPDGDINYQGRGTNQIFAWGLWIYLLSTSQQNKELEQALNYLSPRLENMLKKKSMMLNNWEGLEKYLWWDYHYSSVYTAHCLLWLILSVLDADKSPICPCLSQTSETGLHTYRSSNFFLNWFEGRTEYLAEKGPAISAIWSKSQGMICKGTFAPWYGNFGNKYIYDDVVLKNYCGLLAVNHNKDWHDKKLIHKLFPNIKSTPSCTLKPLFLPIKISEKDDCLEIIWENIGEKEFIFNLPCMKEDCVIKLYVDENPLHTFCTEAIKNQYDWVFLYQSKKSKGRTVKLHIY